MGEEPKLPKKLRSMKNELGIAVRKKDDERTKRAIRAICDYAENLKKIRAKPEAIKAAYDLTTPLGFGDPALEPQPAERGGRGRRGPGRGGTGRGRPSRGGPGRGGPGAGRGGPGSSGKKRGGPGGSQRSASPPTRPQQSPPGSSAPSPTESPKSSEPSESPTPPEPPASDDQKE
jgi:hypothetical protein